MTARPNATLRWATTAALAVFASILSGCGATIPGLTTSAVKGPPEAANDTTSRAIEVGSTSARALKCGFNFDPAKLRTQYLAADGAANPADAEKIAKAYDIAFNGVSKAVATQGESYCSAGKTGQIKEALNRHLAGDYTLPPPQPSEEDEGLLGSLGSVSAGDSDYHKKLEGGPEKW